MKHSEMCNSALQWNALLQYITLLTPFQRDLCKLLIIASEPKLRSYN